MELRLADLKELKVGPHPFRDGMVTLRQNHVEMFNEDPNTVFTVMRSEQISSAKIQYVIGTAKV